MVLNLAVCKTGVFAGIFAILSLPQIPAQVLPDMDTRNAAGDKGSVHEFLDSSDDTLIALSMAEDRDTGEEQLQALLETHRALERTTPFRDQRVLHVTVITGAPWFVHGVIRNGLADEYEPPVEEDQIIVLFIDDLEEFSDEVAVPVDRRPSWLSVSPDGSVNWWERDRGGETAEILSEQLDR